MNDKINFDIMVSSIACNDRDSIEKIKQMGKIKLNNGCEKTCQMKIKFLEDPINDLFLKRSETSEISIHSKFIFESLPGKHLALLENGYPAFSFFKDEYYFNFDPFYSIKYYLNEEGPQIPNSFMNRLFLKCYWTMPRRIRLIARKMARKKKRGKIYQPNHFIGTSTNVLTKIIENCLMSNGFNIEKVNHLFAITHDIDTKVCYNDGIRLLREIENKLKVPATGFFIPFGHEYKPHPSVLQELSDETFEIGMHGYSHDGLILKEAQESLEKKLQKALNFFQTNEIEIFGYRSPWAQRNNFLLESLGKFDFHYDSSSPDQDTLALTRPLVGLHYNRPIIKKIGIEGGDFRKIVQIPISYPQDVQILEDYHLDDEEAFSYLKYKIDFIKDFEGFFIFHTHPIHVYNRIEFFEKVIEYTRSMNYKPVMMKEISSQFLDII